MEKLRKWQIGYVWLIYRFRKFVELEKEAAKLKNEGMRRHWWDKRTHIWNKIKEHEQCAPKEIQVEELMHNILGMIAQGKHPKQIIEELEERAKKDKSPPSNSGPIV